jgi:hypothetical protein
MGYALWIGLWTQNHTLEQTEYSSPPITIHVDRYLITANDDIEVGQTIAWIVSGIADVELPDVADMALIALMFRVVVSVATEVGLNILTLKQAPERVPIGWILVQAITHMTSVRKGWLMTEDKYELFGIGC